MGDNMKKTILAICLIFSMVLFVKPSIAHGESGLIEVKNAVYLGIKDYNKAEFKNRDNFVHRFSIKGKEENYKLAKVGNYELQNQLDEGYVYDIRIDENSVVKEITPSVPIIAGKVDSLVDNFLNVSDVYFQLTDETRIYSINRLAGGTQVNSVEIGAGDMVKIYGDNPYTIYKTFVGSPYTSPVKGTPGVRTIKNFLQTSLEPVGTALYVYGGAWNWTDDGSSKESRTIGLSQSWIDFFQSKDSSYSYKNNKSITKSYYPHKKYNQYNHAGIDCSGYIGWAVYNTMNTESGNTGFVIRANNMAKSYAEDFAMGTRSRTFESKDFRPGDIFSMKGHVWTALGVCDDGSIVILHSSPTKSKKGSLGGGVQIGAIGANSNCEAMKLAKEYMSKYYPAWSERYNVTFYPYSKYTALSSPIHGKFTWNDGKSGLLDPDGYRDMKAKEVLVDLFNENVITATN